MKASIEYDRQHARVACSRTRPPVVLWFLWLALATQATAQLVTLSIESHVTPPEENQPSQDAVVFIVNAYQPISGFHLRLIEPGVSLHRDQPPWLDIWTLNDWQGRTSLDGREYHAEFTPTGFPVPITSYFGFEFGPDPILKNALLHADVSYDRDGIEHEFSVVPEPSSWGDLAALFAGAVALARLAIRRGESFRQRV